MIGTTLLPEPWAQTYYHPARRQRQLPLPDYDRPEHVAAMIERKRHRKRLAKAKVRRRCRYCGRSIKHKREAQVDHVVPRCRGGADDPRNLVLCCKDCNLSKGDFLPEEWAASILSVVGMRPVAVIPDPIHVPRRRKGRRTLAGRLRSLAAAVAASLSCLVTRGDS